MALDNPVTDGKTQSRALAELLRGEERVEYPKEVAFRDALTLILDMDQHGAIAFQAAFRLDENIPAQGHGVHCVRQEVAEHLFRPIAVSYRVRDAEWYVDMNPAPAPHEDIVETADHAIDERREVYRLELDGMMPGKDKEILDEGRNFRRVIVDDLQVPEDRVGKGEVVRLHLEAFDAVQDDTDGIVDLVAEPCGKLACGGQFFRLDQA